MPDYKITLKNGTSMIVKSPSYFEAIADARVSTSDLLNVQEVMDDFPDNGASS